MNRSKPSVENVECAHPTCGHTPIADSPVPLCARHIGQTYEFAADLLCGSGQMPPEQWEAEARVLGGALRTGADDAPMSTMAQMQGPQVSTLVGRRMMTVEMWGVTLSPDDKAAMLKQAAADARERAERVAMAITTDNPDPGQVVYYIRFGDRVKIGSTGNLARRLKDLPHDELLATEPGTTVTEFARHAQFDELRITGEWFQYVEPLTDHIDGLRRAVA